MEHGMKALTDLYRAPSARRVKRRPPLGIDGIAGGTQQGETLVLPHLQAAA